MRHLQTTIAGADDDDEEGGGAPRRSGGRPPVGEGVEADRIRGRVRASVADLAWRGAEEEWTVASFFLFFFVSFFFFAVWSFWLVWDGARVCVCVRAATLDWEGSHQLLMVMALGFASNGRGSLTDVVMC